MAGVIWKHGNNCWLILLNYYVKLCSWYACVEFNNLKEFMYLDLVNLYHSRLAVKQMPDVP